jgi:hypothetical protein
MTRRIESSKLSTSPKEDKELTVLPYGIQKPYKKNTTKQQILPNLSTSTENNKISPVLISHKSK